MNNIDTHVFVVCQNKITMSGGNIMSFEGCNYFRQRLILSTLSGKTVRIKKIRSKEDDPGLKGDFKINNVIV